MTTARECQWSAQLEGSWLSLRSTPSGQGDGMVEVAASPNPDPQNRRGAVVLNNQRVDITQAPGECVITLADSSSSFAPIGGSGRVDVRASSSLCTWTAASDSDWITIRSSAGQGSAPVLFDVAPTTGPPRSGQLTVANQRFSVTQSQGCAYAIAPLGHSAPEAGGSSTIAVTTTAACPWTAASNAPWITVTQGSSGTGPGAVIFLVAPAVSVARTGTLVVAGELFSVTQPASSSPSPAPPGPGPAPPPPPPPPPPASCAIVVAPSSHTFGATGGSATVTVTAGNACAWTASTAVPWISIQGATSGSASGSVTFTVAATTGPPRTGTLTIGGQTVTVTQSQGCTYAIEPETQSIGAGGGDGSVAVTAAAGCTWTATSNASWLTIASGAAGSGNGTVRFNAAATTGPSRSGSLTIAGRTFTVNQGQGCTFRREPTSATVPASGGTVEFELLTEAGCAWTASDNVPWISVLTTGGTGSARIRFTADANTGPVRNGTVTAGGRSFTVTQESGCAYTLSAANQSVDGAGGTGSVGVATAAACAWAATSEVDWISITSGANGSGNGSVAFTVASNPGAPRTGNLSIAGRAFTITQGASCTFSIAPEQQAIDPAGGTATVAVTAANGCSWTASTDTPWLSIASNPGGTGNGSVQVAVSGNPGPPRSGVATIAGRTFTVNQGQACAFDLDPDQQPVDAAGGTPTVTVLAAAGCGWTAVSESPWISIVSGAAGSGNGSVQIQVAANTGAPRTGTARIAGLPFTVIQAGGCSFVVAPTSISAPADGLSSRVDVTADAACSWSASTPAPWITITVGSSGSGNGPVEFTIAPNAGPARDGVLTVAGHGVTVSQASGCAFALSATSLSLPVGGGPGSVTVTTGDGCAWTAVSQVSWIIVTPGAGAGTGTVQFTVAVNDTGAARSGTIQIGGQTFTVNQE